MATQNLIQIKRSETTAEPGSLANGELAWSGNGDVLFIGNFGSVTAIASATSGNIIDDDTFATASNTSLATSESIKSYVDTEIANVVAGAATNLNDLSDVDTSGVAQGDVLAYNGSTWVDYDVTGINGITVSSNTTAIAVNVIANNGIIANTTGVFVDGANGITVTAAGVNVLAANDTITVTGSGIAVAENQLSIDADQITGTLDSARLPDLAVSDFGDAAIQTGTEVGANGSSIGDNDTSLLTAAAIINYVEGKNYSDTTGTVTSVDSGNGLTGGPITGSGTLAVGAANGISVSADAVAVDGANGISVTTAGVNVLANNGITVTADGVFVLANNGIIANTTGVFVDGANGTSVTAAGVNVLANNGISVTSDGVFVDGANGISVTSAGVNVLAGNNDINVNSTGVWISSIALGTQTTGDYVESVTGTTNEIEVSASTGAVTVGLPNDVVIQNNLTVSNDLTVAGDFTVTGNVVSINVTELKVEDSLIHLASNNFANALDIGFVGHYSTDGGSTVLHNGIVWDASNGNFIAFDSLVQAGLDNGDTTINTGDGSFNLATIHANIDAANATIGTLTLTSDLTVPNGGTGASSFTDNGIIYGNGTGALSVTAAGTQYQVLQAGSGGVPEWGSLDGGTF